MVHHNKQYDCCIWHIKFEWKMAVGCVHAVSACIAAPPIAAAAHSTHRQYFTPFIYRFGYERRWWHVVRENAKKALGRRLHSDWKTDTAVFFFFFFFLVLLIGHDVCLLFCGSRVRCAKWSENHLLGPFGAGFDAVIQNKLSKDHDTNKSPASFYIHMQH